MFTGSWLVSVVICHAVSWFVLADVWAAEIVLC